MTKTPWIPVLCLLSFAVTGAVRAGSLFQGRAGFGFRGAYWNPNGQDGVVRVSNSRLFDSKVDVSGAGGWLMFLSGVGSRGCIEFSIGGVGRAEVTESGLFQNEVKASGAMPILIGFQYPLLGDRGLSAFQPYVSAGGGPYLLSRVHVADDGWNDAEVSVRNRVRPGAYAAAGGYFLFADWFAVNGELRYHLVNLDPENEHSGTELGLGLAFFWKR